MKKIKLISNLKITESSVWGIDRKIITVQFEVDSFHLWKILRKDPSMPRAVVALLTSSSV
jgi:hypothetical protein